MRDTDLLVIIDPQIDFCEGGALAVPGADDAFMANLSAFSQRFDNIVISQDYHPAGHSSFASSHPGLEPFTQIEKPYGEDTLWPDHCIQGTQGVVFHPYIVAGWPLQKAHLIIRKGMNPEIDSYSAFRENDKRTKTGLFGYVKERKFQRVFFVGLAFDYCVKYSAIDLKKLQLDGEEISSIVVQDMTRGISPDDTTTIDELLLEGVQICGSNMVF